jgi:threonine aldolase
VSLPLVDLRSDTVTRPTEAMRRAMCEAEVGDDVLQEDPTVNALEARAAELVGKEAALFVPSGTFGNQLALFTLCRRGQEVVLSDSSHIVQHEAGAAAVIAGVQLRAFSPARGYPSWSDVAPRLRRERDIHFPETGCVALENALFDGEVLPLATLDEISARSREAGVPLYMDGARIFNAALYLGVEAARIASSVDSLMFCLSKGLCAPVGSLLTGSKDFVRAARWKRKIMGGGMRQAGILAAAGVVALASMRARLREDHEKAAALAEAFLGTGVVEVKPQPPKINLFFVRFNAPHLLGREDTLVLELARRGVRTYPPDQGWLRFVTHHDVSAEAVGEACAIVRETVGGLAG